jgi:hypothetical protein
VFGGVEWRGVESSSWSSHVSDRMHGMEWNGGSVGRQRARVANVLYLHREALNEFSSVIVVAR